MCVDILMDENLSNNSDLEEINPASSSKNENNEFLPLLEQEFLNNNADTDDNTDTEKVILKDFLPVGQLKKTLHRHHYVVF